MSESNAEIASIDRLRSHIFTLADAIGERNVFRADALQAAAMYITEEWTQQGYSVNEQAYDVHGVRCANLEIVKRGHKRPDDILLVGAHYDSVRGSPGANDNGSGVAALLEMSRLFTRLETSSSVRFVAFVNEEPPFFPGQQMGSQVYAQDARARGDRIRLMVALETIGYYSDEPGSQQLPPLLRFFYPSQARFIAFVSNLRSRKLMRQAVQAFRSFSDFPVEHLATLPVIPGVSWSDHHSFWQQGYRAFMITDTAFYRYPYYHTAADTPDKVDYESLAGVTEGLIRSFHLLATKEIG